MDKQYAAAVILILIGLGLTQVGDEQEVFLSGLGMGVVVMAIVWIAAIIIRDIRRK